MSKAEGRTGRSESTHHEDVGGSLDHLVKTNDVRVHEQAQDLDFATHCAEPQRARVSATLTGARADTASGPAVDEARASGVRRTFLVHVHSLDFLAVQDLYRNLVSSQRVLCHLDLRVARAV